MHTLNILLIALNVFFFRLNVNTYIHKMQHKGSILASNPAAPGFDNQRSQEFFS